MPFSATRGVAGGMGAMTKEGCGGLVGFWVGRGVHDCRFNV
jgi:hypothetical protein